MAFGGFPDIGGGVIGGTYNLLGTGGLANGINGNLVGSSESPIDPLLGPLQDNGGPTLTHALLPGSPAINVGDPGFTPPPDFDQRGAPYSRIAGGRIDIGAFEVQTASAPSADFDNDGFITGIDFLFWQRGFGTTAPDAEKADGDADNDLDSDASDFSLWESQFGTAAPLVATATATDPAESVTVESSPSNSPTGRDLFGVAVAYETGDKASLRKAIPVYDESYKVETAVDRVLASTAYVPTVRYEPDLELAIAFARRAKEADESWLADKLLGRVFE
jgi:hypothetical protein